MKDERTYIEHILESVSIVLDYTASGRDSLSDPKTQDAVIRRLQVMAESCLRLSDERIAAYPDVGWQHIRNFRKRLVHEYLDVDLNLVWTIIERSLPPLQAAVESMLAE